MYEYFEHTADVGLRARAGDLDTLFAEAARGLFALIVDNLDAVHARRDRSIQLPAAPTSDLFFDWLGELLYTFETPHLLLSTFDVHITPTGLSATVAGEPVDPDRHRLGSEVKAVTYHGLTVQKDQDGYVAEVILDI